MIGILIMRIRIAKYRMETSIKEADAFISAMAKEE